MSEHEGNDVIMLDKEFDQKKLDLRLKMKGASGHEIAMAVKNLYEQERLKIKRKVVAIKYCCKCGNSFTEKIDVTLFYNVFQVKDYFCVYHGNIMFKEFIWKDINNA